MRRFYTAFAIFLVAAAAATGTRAAESADTVADRFYAIYQTLPPGVPASVDLVRLQPLLSEELLGLLKQAAAAEVTYAKANAREPVPPLVEGDLFTSLFEGADKFRVGLCNVSDENVFCPTVLSHTEGGVGESKTTDWTDTLVLAAGAGGSWKVDDVLYGGKWDFARRGSLKDALREVVEQAKAIAK